MQGNVILTKIRFCYGNKKKMRIKRKCAENRTLHPTSVHFILSYKKITSRGFVPIVRWSDHPDLTSLLG